MKGRLIWPFKVEGWEPLQRVDGVAVGNYSILGAAHPVDRAVGAGNSMDKVVQLLLGCRPWDGANEGAILDLVVLSTTIRGEKGNNIPAKTLKALCDKELGRGNVFKD